MDPHGQASEEVPLRSVRTAVRCALAAGLILGGSGCGLAHLDQMNFRTDDRVAFTSPKDRATVRPPVTISWTVHDFRIAAKGSEPPSHDAGYFAVFVDRTPIRPGQTLDAVAKGDRFCEQDPKCPDASYLREHAVYTTTHTSLRLTQIRNIVGDNEKVQLHAVTVVLLDTAGRRIGESAWELDLRIPALGISG